MMPLQRLGWMVFGVLALAACEKEQPPAPQAQEVILNVRTVDLANQPVEMVRFYINGKKFGITDQDGSFKGRFPAKNGDTLSFNVEPPQGYSVPPNVDQSEWTFTVAYPANGQSLQIDFSATLQRPEKDYLFMVSTAEAGQPVVVNAKRVGKTGPNGHALLRVTGVPGAPYTASAGAVKSAGTFAEEDEVYLLTAKRSGPIGGSEPVAAAAAPGDGTPAEPTPAAAPATEAPAVAAVEPPPPAPPVEDTPPPVRDEPPAVAVAAAPERDNTDLFAAARPSANTERRRPSPPPARVEAVEPPPRAFEPDPPAAVEPDPPVAVEPDPPAAPSGGGGLDELFDDPPAVAQAAPPPVDEPPADVAALLDDPVADAPPVIAAAPPAAQAGARRKETGDLGEGILEDDGNVVDRNAINRKVTVAGGASPSAASMNRNEISQRLDVIKSNLARTNVLQKADVDFLAQIDKTHPGYYEANRLLADFYYKLGDFKRQTEALEIATTRGRYKHDPSVLLSLSKAYARRKNYRKALSTMRRVEAKMRRLDAARKADAYRFHAEILEFEFQRQFNDDPKRANVTLVDKAISKWERYETFSRGANAGAVAKAQGKIRELNELKSRVEL